MSDHSHFILLDIKDGIAEIRFNRPEKLNAMGMELALALDKAVTQVVEREDVRVIVLAAEGRSWMAGGDLGYFHSAECRPAAAKRLVGMIVRILSVLHAAPQIVISSLKGPVAGGGMGVALCADMIIAANDTVFTSAYAKIAITPDCGMSWTLPRTVGLCRAMEIVLLSESFDAAEAQRLGLVNRVVQASQLERETRKLAARVAQGGAQANAHTKALIRGAMSRDFDTQLAAELASFIACSASGDFGRGLEKFFAAKPR